MELISIGITLLSFIVTMSYWLIRIAKEVAINTNDITNLYNCLGKQVKLNKEIIKEMEELKERASYLEDKKKLFKDINNPLNEKEKHDS